MNTEVFFTQKNMTIWWKSFLVIIFFSFAFTVDAATLSISPSTGVYTAGQTFTTRILVNTNGKSINAADGTISFNPGELSVVRVSKGSIFNLWTAEPAFSNTSGTITFSGGSPSGYRGSAGTVISVTFRAKNAGVSKVRFTNGSVLAADGLGTNVLTNMNGGSFTIAAADITPEPETIEYIAPANTPAAPDVKSSTHVNSDAWYTEKTAKLSWSIPAGVTAVRTLLDENSGSIPTKVYQTPISSIVLEGLEEGVQYFHIQFKNDDGWGRVTHYRLAVDSSNPTEFSINLAEDADLSNPEQTLVFDVKDKISEVRRFLVQLNGSEPYEYIDETGSGSMKLLGLLPGTHSVIIEAFDQAGNSIVGTFSFTILSFDKPQFTEYPSEINEEVIPVIKGVTRPNSSVQVTLLQTGLSVSSENAQRVFEVQSDKDGAFIFIPDGRLSLGVYELTAIAIDENGARSDVSDTIRIAVQQPGYLRIGSLAVSILSVIVPLTALSGLLFIGVWYFVYKLRRLRSSVSKEAKEAMDILSAEFDSLQKELKKQEAILIKSRRTKKLTKAEKQVLQTVSNALMDSRKRVQKEISDVEDVIE